MSIRLNKLLAERGIGARRKCDALIQSGSVRVNGSVVKEPGMRVEPERDRVSVEGRPLPAAAPLRYYALNKPVGVITTLDDPERRRTIRELLPPGPRLFPVGRLDADTSGLLIVTNDGELAHRLMHPRYGVDKIYRVRLDRVPDARELDHLRSGVEFEPGITSGPARVRVLDPGPTNAMIEISIHEGRYRQVRRMCEALGLRVLGLHRAGYGPLRLGPLARGMWRELSEVELRRLRSASSRPRPRPAFAIRRAQSGPRRPDREEAVALRPRPAGPRRPEAGRARRPRRGPEHEGPRAGGTRRGRAVRAGVGPKAARRSRTQGRAGGRRPFTPEHEAHDRTGRQRSSVRGPAGRGRVDRQRSSVRGTAGRARAERQRTFERGTSGRARVDRQPVSARGTAGSARVDRQRPFVRGTSRRASGQNPRRPARARAPGRRPGPFRRRRGTTEG